MLTKDNLKLTRMNDLGQKKLAEYKCYSAAEVVDGIKPSLAPVQGIVANVGNLEKLVVDIGNKLMEKIQSGNQVIFEEFARGSDDRKMTTLTLSST